MAKRFKPVNIVKRYWMEEIRNEMKLTIRQMALKIGDISWQHYADIESGRRNPSIEMSYMLANFYNVPVERFFEDRTKFKARGDKQNDVI